MHVVREEQESWGTMQVIDVSSRQYILASRVKRCRVGRRPMHVVRGEQENRGVRRRSSM